MINKDYEAQDKKQQKGSRGCGCGSCGEQIKVKEQCNCDSCRKKNHKPVERIRDNCKWKEYDRLRERRCQTGLYNENKFAWEIDCECIGCRY